MFREMRNVNKPLTKEDCINILKNNHSGVLSLISPDGYPYGVPMTYVYMDGKIVVHSSIVGHKMDCIKSNPKVCFTIIDYDELSEDSVTNFYRSAIVFGTASIVEENEKKFEYISRFTGELVGKPMRPCMPAVRTGKFPMEIIIIEPEHMTAKESTKHSAPQYKED